MVFMVTNLCCQDHQETKNKALVVVYTGDWWLLGISTGSPNPMRDGNSLQLYAVVFYFHRCFLIHLVSSFAIVSHHSQSLTFLGMS